MASSDTTPGATVQAFGPHVQLERHLDHIGVIYIKRDPVNSANTALWKSLLDALEASERDPTVRAVVFASALAKDVFLAGNDLQELYAPITSAARYQTFWTTLTTFLARVYRSPLVVATAARGFCPAGGTAILLASDVRVISDVTACGLNEVALGIPVPGYWAQLMARIVGDGLAEQICLEGTMMDAASCVRHGLAHVAVPAALVVDEAVRRVLEILKHPDHGRQTTKELMRGEFSRAWVRTMVTLLSISSDMDLTPIPNPIYPHPHPHPHPHTVT